MSTDSDFKRSHFSLGSEDNSELRKSGTYANAFKVVDVCCYAQHGGLSATSELRKHHFQLGTGAPSNFKSTNHASYPAHSDFEKAKLSEAVRKDLRASHFSIGSDTGPAVYLTSSMVGLPSYCESRCAPSKPETRSTKSLLGHEENSCSFETEATAAYRPYFGVHKGKMAKSVQEDLRRSHFNHAGEGKDSDYMSVAQLDYKIPPVPTVNSIVENREAMKSLKRELTRSHFALWQGSMKGYISETKSAFKHGQRS